MPLFEQIGLSPSGASLWKIHKLLMALFLDEIHEEILFYFYFLSEASVDV